jgi:hypothetical protein
LHPLAATRSIAKAGLSIARAATVEIACFFDEIGQFSSQFL